MLANAQSVSATVERLKEWCAEFSFMLIPPMLPDFWFVGVHPPIDIDMSYS